MSIQPDTASAAIEVRLRTFTESCRACGLKLTPQRLEIFRELAATTRHPSVEDIHQRIRTRMPNVSLDTVYRTLSTLHEHGIYTVAAQKAVSVGIQRVEERLKVAGDGKPRLFVFRDALVQKDPALAEKRLPTCTAEEFGTYVWAEGVDGKPNKEEPTKLHDHGMDAMRYLCMHLENETGPVLLGLNRYDTPPAEQSSGVGSLWLGEI